MYRVQQMRPYSSFTSDAGEKDANQNGERCRDICHHLIVGWSVQLLNVYWVQCTSNQLTILQVIRPQVFCFQHLSSRVI